jgi:signal transduction histidine kinase
MHSLEKALAPIDAMGQKAQQISAENLSERLSVENPEIGKLASVFNAMLERLQAAFEQLRRFTADASHELRTPTPLTATRSVGEVALQDHRNADEYRDVIGSMLEEVDRLTRLVESLLVLSRADAGHIFRARISHCLILLVKPAQ